MSMEELNSPQQEENPVNNTRESIASCADNLSDTLYFDQATHLSISLPSGTPDSVGNSILLSEIARGGMGVVIKALDTTFDREVAVKVLQEKYNCNPKYHLRILNEARITARLQHPGVVPIFEAGRFPDNRPYFIMRLVNGMNLKQLLSEREDPRNELTRFLKIFEKVCETVAFAHSQGVIHRDLKPSNIMIAPYGVVKVMDWGIAKVIQQANNDLTEFELAPMPDEPELTENLPANDEQTDSLTEYNSVLGTPEYMPPEQANCDWEHLDERADVFGLGAILCEILTGQGPYEGTTPFRVLRKASQGNMKPAMERLDCCFAERELVQIAKNCLAPRQDDRPRNAGVVARALADYLESDLRRVERDMVRFFELSLDLFCLASMDGFFLRVNSNFSRVLGYTSQELLTKPFLDFVHPDDRHSTLEVMKDLAQGNPVVRFRNRYRHVAGHHHWLEWTAKSVPQEALIFAVARDVTDRFEADGL